MSFGDHIEDLRTHLLRALKGFVIGMVLGFWPLGHMCSTSSPNPSWIS